MHRHVGAAKAEAAASAAAAAAARSQCRFLTLEEMSAAVTQAAGRTYTALSMKDNEYDCAYRFSETEAIQVDFSSSTTFRPGTGDQTLTVDGLRAIYGPSEGTRALSVYVPNGNFTVVVYQMGLSGTVSRNIGIEVFRVARRRLP